MLDAYFQSEFFTLPVLFAEPGGGCLLINILGEN